jgi:osomolarity two-component system sensor histidine kinase NIK1
MNGLDATIKIRQIENERQIDHPAIIIALSANVLSNDIQHCFEVGMNEFISKPFSSEKLLERIKIYFKLR